MTAVCPYAIGRITRVLQPRALLMPCSPASVSLLYPCDLPEAEWPHLAPLFPAPAQRGRPRAWPLRLLVKALLYVLRAGGSWRVLPHESPPWQPTDASCRQGRLHGVWQRVHEAWRRAVRLRAGRPPAPSAALRESQSGKTTGSCCRYALYPQGLPVLAMVSFTYMRNEANFTLYEPTQTDLTAA